MISASRRWFKRYRTPIAIGVGVISAGYIAGQYVIGKISEARERMSSDRIARENLRRRFEQNQEDCTFTVLALLPTATDNVLAELETERIAYELQQQKAARIAKSGEPASSQFGSTPPSVTDDDGRSTMSMQSESGVHASQIAVPPPGVTGDARQDGLLSPQKTKKTKLQLWNDLKISSVTRAFTLIYTLALLTLLTRIQLNLLGRRSYLSSVVSLATGALDESTISLENHDDDNPDQAYGNDFETNRRYLTFSWWLLHRGWKDLMLRVQQAVTEVFGTLSIRDDITIERFSELTIQVRKRIEGLTEAERRSKKWLSFLLPPRDQEEFVLRESGMINEADLSSSPVSSANTPLRRLLDETSDLIDSPTFSFILTLLLDAGFSTLVDQKLSQLVYNIQPTPDISDPNAPRVQEVTESKPAKVPIILALLTKQAHSIGNGMPNEYLSAMEQVRDLEAFAAIVYSSNWENEISPMSEPNTTEPVASGVGESVIDVGTASSFEKAWGKAVDTGDRE